jgi:hypothetical protein
MVWQTQYLSGIYAKALYKAREGDPIEDVEPVILFGITGRFGVYGLQKR